MVDGLVDARIREGGRPPNVLLVNCDDLGWGDLGCYGSDLNDTPVIDRLAAEGARLTDFYAASPVCSPSRAALLTGCYPTRVGFGDFGGAPVLFPGHAMGLHPDETTLARVLNHAGHRTSLVGKWHCGDQPEFLPTNHGFEEYFGLPYSNDMGVQAWFDEFPPYVEFLAQLGVELDIDHMPPLPLVDGSEVVESQPDQADLTQRYLDACLDFIRRRSDEPFFLYLAHMYVHLPLYVEERFADASRNGAYGAAVACIDWVMGELLDELDRLGLAGDTVVVFTSDNGSRAQGGGGSNGPLRAFKGTTWDGGQRVPCIVRWPGRIEAGSEVSAPLSMVDLMPTIAAWCGAAMPADRRTDGRDLGPLLEGQTSEIEHDGIWFYDRNTLEAVRSGRWKLHVSRGGEPTSELYDLIADIGEQVDLSSDHPDVVAELTALAGRVRADLGDARLGIDGSGVRPIGRVDEPQPMIRPDTDLVSVVAEYDLHDRG